MLQLAPVAGTSRSKCRRKSSRCRATRAEAALGGELVGAVITVPRRSSQRRDQVSKLAPGSRSFELLHEPTTAAIAYRRLNHADKRSVVYDLGGGTFDISILRLTRGAFEVLSANGDSALGGDRFPSAHPLLAARKTSTCPRSIRMNPFAADPCAHGQTATHRA